jgi:integrase
MIRDPEGMIADAVTDNARKGGRSGRTEPAHMSRRETLAHDSEGTRLYHIIGPSTASVPTQASLGRRKFAQRPPDLHHSRRAADRRGRPSPRDVQELAGHMRLAMTRRYIQGDREVKPEGSGAYLG